MYLASFGNFLHQSIALVQHDQHHTQQKVVYKGCNWRRAFSQFTCGQLFSWTYISATGVASSDQPNKQGIHVSHVALLLWMASISQDLKLRQGIKLEYVTFLGKNYRRNTFCAASLARIKLTTINPKSFNCQWGTNVTGSYSCWSVCTSYTL